MCKYHVYRGICSKNPVVSLALFFVSFTCSPPVCADFELILSLSLQSQTNDHAVFAISGSYSVTSPSDGTGTFINQVRLSLFNSSVQLQTPLPSPFTRFSYDANSGDWDGAIDADTGQLAVNNDLTPLLPGNSQDLGLLHIDITGVNAGTYTVSVFEAGFTDGVGEFGNFSEYLVGDHIGTISGGSALLTVTATPEPSSLFLLAGGLAAIRFVSKRKRKR